MNDTLLGTILSYLLLNMWLLEIGSGLLSHVGEEDVVLQMVKASGEGVDPRKVWQSGVNLKKNYTTVLIVSTSQH